MGRPAISEFCSGKVIENRLYSHILFCCIVFEEVDEDDDAFKHCVADIILILTNIEMITDPKVATHCEFISSILQQYSLTIVRKHIKEEKTLYFIEEGYL
ncbi:12731_t:CDS:1 [Acaulospora colombiana]|uniref:12731_t:CDS:1 n=1 Tax=Acaulospora colombiana TaxID=27376 RepID=A0ACA9LKG3_9GLOM|nr:12731_t:CDS:1 [Acaulospora colombiana]